MSGQKWSLGFTLVVMLGVVPVLRPAFALAESICSDSDAFQGCVINSTILEITTYAKSYRGYSGVLVSPKEKIQGNRPDCAQKNPNAFAIFPTDGAGQSALTTILSAAAEGKRVTLRGTGTCNQLYKPDTEELLSVVVHFK